MKALVKVNGKAVATFYPNNEKETKLEMQTRVHQIIMHRYGSCDYSFEWIIDFYVPDEVGKVITPEVRELAKQLFVQYIQLDVAVSFTTHAKAAINDAKEFVQMLDEAE